MKYFRLQQDNRIPNAVLLTDLNNIGGYREASAGNLDALDDVVVSFVNSSKLNFYPDVLNRQLFMVKDAVKEVFDLFLPELEYKRAFLLDAPYNKYERYYIPVLEALPCLSDKSTIDRGRIIDIVLKQEVTKDKFIFSVSNNKEIATIVCLDAVEAILRRKAAGIRITPICLD